MEALDYWRLCDELNIIQSALLVIGSDPGSSDSYVENWQTHDRPQGYEAAKTAICNALRASKIEGKCNPMFEYDINGNQMGEIEDSIDLERSRVDVASLKAWLKSRGIISGFFFPIPIEASDYLDPSHHRYSAKLAAAIAVWNAMEDENLLRGKGTKEAMREWLESRYKELSLVWKDEINKTGIDEIIKVTNWDTSGGAPKTPG